MSYLLTTVSHSTTGIKTITVGFAAKHLRITVAKRGSSTDGVAHMSVGDYDLTADYQVVDSFFTDTTGSETRRLTNAIVNQLYRTGGTIVPLTAAHVDQASAPWTATQVKYIVDTADLSSQYKVEAWD